MAGDQIIVEIARRLEGRCHTSDPVSLPIGGKTPTGEIVLGRLGGDEFGILLERANESSDAMRLANQVQIELNARLSTNVSVAMPITVLETNISSRHLTNPHLLPGIKDCIRDLELRVPGFSWKSAKQSHPRIPSSRVPSLRN